MTERSPVFHAYAGGIGSAHICACGMDWPCPEGVEASRRTLENLVTDDDVHVHGSDCAWFTGQAGENECRDGFPYPRSDAASSQTEPRP